MSYYRCKKCGWEGEVNGRPRCLPCYARAAKRWRQRFPEKKRALAVRMDIKARRERRDEYNARRRRKRSRTRDAEARHRRGRWLAAGDVTREQLIDIWEAARGRCHYCHGPLGIPRFTPTDPRGFDHVVAPAAGGKHTASHIVACCRKCNATKRHDHKEPAQ